MSLQVTIKCDLCGYTSTVSIAENSDIRKVPLQEVPREFLFYDLPNDNHMCFKCANRLVKEQENARKENL